MEPSPVQRTIEVVHTLIAKGLDQRWDCTIYDDTPFSQRDASTPYVELVR